MSSNPVVPASVSLQLTAVTHRFLSTQDVDAELERMIGKLPADLQARLQPEKLRGIVQTKRRYLILKEIDGPRMLAISANESEAAAASMWLGRTPVTVPPTYDLMAQLVERGNRRIARAVIDDVTANGLTAKIELSSPDAPPLNGSQNGVGVIECRPIDAVNLAIRVGAQIETTHAVLLFAGYTQETDTGELIRIMSGVPLPDLPERMAMPKPVVPGSFRGPRSVEDLLSRIARGEVVVVDQAEGFALVPVPPGCVAEAEAIRLAGGRNRLDEAIRRGLIRPRFAAFGDRRAGPFFTRDELDRLQSDRADS